MKNSVPKARLVISSPEGVVLKSEYKTEHVNEKLKEDERVFSPLIHETEIHVPVPVLNVTKDTGVQSYMEDCLDMPIRLKGETEYALPEQWVGLQNVIQTLIDIEHTNNPNWVDYYTYLSVQYTPHLTPGEQQRHAGAHTDGFQGIREPVRTKTSRSYVAVTNGGTRYFPQTFVANLDAGKFNIFEGFDLQVKQDNNGNPEFCIAEENFFYYFDAYTVHESGAAYRSGPRLFVRLTWEMKLFDRAGNTKNQMLKYNWEPVDYDIRSDLKTPTLGDIEKVRMVKK